MFKNTAAATRYLNGNKMTYKITSAGKLTSKGKKRRWNEWNAKYLHATVITSTDY